MNATDAYDATENSTDDGARLTENGIDLSSASLSVEDYVAEEHIEKLAETDNLVVLRDSAGYELSDWADDLGISRGILSEWMHNLARDHYGASDTGGPWSASDPLVLTE